MQSHPPRDKGGVLPFPKPSRSNHAAAPSLRIEYEAADGSRLTVILDPDATVLVRFTANEGRDGGDDGPATRNGFLTAREQAS